MISKMNLFEARTNGYHVYRIPGILCTPGDAVLASVEARRGGGGDYDANDILLRRSTDGGRTWEAPRLIAGTAEYGPGPCSNFALIADRIERCVHGIFCHDYARCFYLCSTDDGASFTSPTEITEVFEEFRSDYPWQVIATGPGHGTQLSTGRLVVPVWISDGSGTEMGPGHRGHRPSVVASIFSDDHGKTWQRGEIICRHDDDINGVTLTNPSETVMAELSDGRVMCNIRSESAANHRAVCISPDGATGWSSPYFDDALLEPICMASMISYSVAGHPEDRGILFANPDALEKEMKSWAFDRKRLTVKFSHDDGKTWPTSRVLEQGPSGYSDMAVLRDGTILCFYECGIIERMGDDRQVTLARFDMTWLQSGSL